MATGNECTCLFCRQPAQEVRGDIDHGTEIECRRCTRYSVSDVLRSIYGRKDGPAIKGSHLISGMIWHGRAPLGYWSCPHFVTEQDFKRLAADAPSRIPDRARVLLESIVRKTQFLGQQVSMDNETWIVISFAKNWAEFYYLYRYIRDLGWVEGDPSPSGGASLTVTPKGFEEIDSARCSNLDSDRAFVAMWFPKDKTLDPAFFEGMKPAVEAAGFQPTRIDLEQHNEDINDRVKAEIRRSRFVVADFTGHRNGVYFEAGFALGLGLPVIWLCRKDHFAKAHFDTNHYNHIVWEKPEEIRTALEDRIIGTIGIGPHKANVTKLNSRPPSK
jgi:hypothetical protein